MLVARFDTNWDSKAILLRFIEKNGISTVFVLTGAGADEFKKCEQWRVYDMQIPGKCVKSSASFARYGVHNTQEVVMKYSCGKVELSKQVWNVAIPYAWTPWASLNLRKPDTYVDILGRVLSKPCLDPAASVPKLLVTLGNESFQQDVYLLGTHAAMALMVGDVVALCGARVHAWKEQRFIQSSYLTVVEINPSARADVSFDISINETGPKCKAIKMSAPILMTASQVLRMQTELVRASELTQPRTTREFSVRGFIGELTIDFFDGDAPVTETSKEEIIRWITKLTDATGVLKVVVWGRAGIELFNASASRVRAMWEDGVENPAKRRQIIDGLNTKLRCEFLALCSMEVRVYGKRGLQHDAQISINAVEVIETCIDVFGRDTCMSSGSAPNEFGGASVGLPAKAARMAVSQHPASAFEMTESAARRYKELRPVLLHTFELLWNQTCIAGSQLRDLSDPDQRGLDAGRRAVEFRDELVMRLDDTVADMLKAGVPQDYIQVLAEDSGVSFTQDQKKVLGNRISDAIMVYELF